MRIAKPIPVSRKLGYVALMALGTAALCALMARAVGMLIPLYMIDTVVAYTMVGLVYGAIRGTADMCSIEYKTWTGNKM